MNAGAVKGEDGKIYMFRKSAWSEAENPQRGQAVEFVRNRNMAIVIKKKSGASEPQDSGVPGFFKDTVQI